jgi:hypothetical protein
MPKINVQVGVVKDAGLFPDPKEVREKRIAEMVAEDKPRKKPAIKKPAVAAKTTRTKKVK